MSSRTITIVRGGIGMPHAAPDEMVVSDDTVRAWALSGGIVRRLWRYRNGRLLTDRLATAGRPMLAWVLRAMVRGRCEIADTTGATRQLTFGRLVGWSARLAVEAVTRGTFLNRIRGDVDRLAARPRHVAVTASRDGVLYLRTDMSFGVRAGGSVGHIVGVLNELAHEYRRATLVTTTDVPTLAPEVDVHQIAIPEAYWNFAELPTFALNDAAYMRAVDALRGHTPALIYQRYSLNNYTGLRLARELGVPFVLEYNGSEIWMSRHWGRPLQYESLSERIELMNLAGADLVVVVSRAMRDEIARRGIPGDRILVNPNAVDPDRYRPDVDGNDVRARYGLDGTVVIGFIGTFGPWHGAEVLARAFVLLVNEHPELRDRVRLLMIGDGVRLGATREIVARGGRDSEVVFSGLVPQEDGPRYLAACDILVSPHVPNPDGTPFFGSPTKLFEYMAMGRPIVASNLDQIGEVLRHGETAWLVPPGDPAALAEALAHVIGDRDLQQRLGAAARADVVAHHTWRAHVRRTLEAVDARLGVRVA